MEHQICSIKRIGDSNYNFIVKTKGGLNLLRIKDNDNKDYDLKKLLLCEEKHGYGMYTHSLEVDVTNDFINFATTQNIEIKEDKDYERMLHLMRIPIE